MLLYRHCSTSKHFSIWIGETPNSILGLPRFISLWFVCQLLTNFWTVALKTFPSLHSSQITLTQNKIHQYSKKLNHSGFILGASKYFQVATQLDLHYSILMQLFLKKSYFLNQSKQEVVYICSTVLVLKMWKVLWKSKVPLIFSRLVNMALAALKKFVSSKLKQARSWKFHSMSKTFSAKVDSSFLTIDRLMQDICVIVIPKNIRLL